MHSPDTLYYDLDSVIKPFFILYSNEGECGEPVEEEVVVEDCETNGDVTTSGSQAVEMAKVGYHKNRHGKLDTVCLPVG